MWFKSANDSLTRIEPVSQSKGGEFLNDGQLNRATRADRTQLFCPLSSRPACPDVHGH